MVITIASPDKLSISMFLSYMRFCYKNDCKIGAIQSLWTLESINKYVDELLKTPDFNNVLFSFYAKRKVNVEPKEVVPLKLVEVSDMIVWMDLYSVEWKVLKDTLNQAPSLLERWKKNMSKIGGSNS